MAAKRKGGLLPKQELFAHEYVAHKDKNATAAYKRAGYKGTGNVAEAAASRMLRDVKVRAFIDFLIAKQVKRTQITADLTVTEAWVHFFRCVSAGDNAAANKALELVGKSNNAFPNKIHIGGTGVPIKVVGIEIVAPVARKETEGDRDIPV